ncbi:MAG: hemerythrin domain-containing protein [Burkholderiales bacterium]
MARAQNGGKSDAIEMLLEDHRRMQKLFKDFERADRDDQEAVREFVETACMELQIHSMLEEEIFYPALRAHLANGKAEERLNRAEVEHEAADELVAKLLDLAPDNPMYSAYFAVLEEYVKHHIREEEKELFVEARKAGGLDLEKLGEDMLRRREELFAQIESDEEDESEPDGEAEDDLETPTDVSDLTDAVAEELQDEQESVDPRRTRH